MTKAGATIEEFELAELEGFARQKRRTERYRGAEHVIVFLPESKIEVVPDGPLAERAVHAIRDAARTDTIRIRSGEEGLGALWPATPSF